jgi:hypothetical protein
MEIICYYFINKVLKIKNDQKSLLKKRNRYTILENEKISIGGRHGRKN